METIRVLYAATNETYYALRSMDSEHLREAIRAGCTLKWWKRVFTCSISQRGRSPLRRYVGRSLSRFTLIRETV